jgi:hypothetical protein
VEKYRFQNFVRRLALGGGPDFEIVFMVWPSTKITSLVAVITIKLEWIIATPAAMQKHVL